MHTRVRTERIQWSWSLESRDTWNEDILISVQALHKDPQYWENPEEYDPERFDSDRKHNIDRFFLPFGEPVWA